MREDLLIAAALENAFSCGETTALATTVNVKGSAYRREGSKVLIDSQGGWIGTLSSGCLEPEVRTLGGQVIAQTRPVLQTFDLSDNSVWGLGVGCGGRIEILIEPVVSSPLWQRWAEALRRGVTVVRAISCEATPGKGLLGSVLLWLDPSEVISAPGHERLFNQIAAAAARIGAAEKPVSARELIEGQWIFFDVSLPPWQLLVFGGGDDAIPLVELAQRLGFQVTVVDPRPAYLNQARFPSARLIAGRGRELPGRLQLSDRSFAVVMNHHYVRDCESLAFLLSGRPRYVGVLGPRERFQRLLAEVEAQREQPVSREVLGRVHNPVGLDIGAEEPQEVALSIMAEILAVRQEAGAGFLYETRGRIHQSRRE